MKKLRWFGTDGIRGVKFEGIFVPSVLARVGCAFAEYLQEKFSQINKDSLWVLIGIDTRDSGPAFACALASGLKERGVNGGYLGVCSSSALAWLTRYYDASFGVMISASHNPAVYNGIKCFDSKGEKLSVEEEMKIELFIEQHLQEEREINMLSKDTVTHTQLPYEKTLVSGRNLRGLRVVLDGAHGSLWKFAEHCFNLCGAQVVSCLGGAPNGNNINEESGVLHPRYLQKAVVKEQADLGFCFDGDGDRVGVVDHLGNYWNGDHILAVLAQDDSGIVGTVMSNYGLELHCAERGKSFLRVDVGDRWIAQALKTRGLRWGGESSGHIIDNDFLSVGDGLWVALEVSTRFMQKEKNAIFPGFVPYPMIQCNVPIDGSFSLTTPQMRSCLRALHESIAPNIRLVLRGSGTEPVIRILLEGPCALDLNVEMERIKDWLFQHAGVKSILESSAA
ncbi:MULTISPECIES: phosphohexomutase domain-containing protein [Holospora]|uniref:Phosphoglucosamine mutase n=2 Tax=Holospora TaxID=44747 RepID=A0A061JFX4_9PROT|nr:MULTISPECIES: hypothetical protein [Holospora]ETZ04676.1 phosphoglucosamine mutase [Holospora undulata HU1]GAJ46243.1 phosphoglucosamine mutase [Holospora elegans E1]